MTSNKTADHIARMTLEILDHHFPGREALLNTVTDREFAKLLAHIEARPLRGPMEAKLIAVIEGYYLKENSVNCCVDR